MESSRLGSIRLVHRTDGDRLTLRRHPAWLRLTALVVLGTFVSVSVATTAYSLGAYCLTTWGGLPPSDQYQPSDQ